MNKYHNVPVEKAGHFFDSKREASRFQELCLLQQAGHIRDLELQPKFPLVVNGVLICTYIADFRYIDTVTGKTVVEDSKGIRTAAYSIKAKLVRAIYGFDIVEV